MPKKTNEQLRQEMLEETRNHAAWLSLLAEMMKEAAELCALAVVKCEPLLDRDSGYGYVIESPRKQHRGQAAVALDTVQVARMRRWGTQEHQKECADNNADGARAILAHIGSYARCARTLRTMMEREDRDQEWEKERTEQRARRDASRAEREARTQERAKARADMGDQQPAEAQTGRKRAPKKGSDEFYKQALNNLLSTIGKQ